MTTQPDTTQLNPGRILMLGQGYMEAKTVLSAVELRVFTALAGHPMTGAALAEALGLHARAIPDFPDALVALGLLEREGEGPEGIYRNTAETAAFFDRGSPRYAGAILEMCNERLYGFWGDLTTALRTGEPQNEIKHTGQSLFASFSQDPDRLGQFMAGMAGVGASAFHALSEQFDFTRYRTVCDAGGGTAGSRQLG